MSSGSLLPSDPAGWIAFEANAGESKYWLETQNTTGGFFKTGWDYPWTSNQDAPRELHFSTILSMTSKVERDFAGINSSGGPQVAGRAEHDEIEISRYSDLLTPILFQFVSTAEAFSRVFIILPEYGGSPRVEWLLKDVNLTLFQFTGNRSNASTLRYSSKDEFNVTKSISTAPTARYYGRSETIRLLYTSAEVRVGKIVNSSATPPVEARTDFRGWHTGNNQRIASYPNASGQPT